MLNLFVSYRRDDAEGFAGWMAGLLRSAENGSEPNAVYLDVDDIAPGVNFVHDMVDAVRGSDIVLVMIGPRWYRSTLLDADDAVRLEIEAAFEARVPVWCLRINATPLPDTSVLPPSLHALAAAPQFVLSDGTFGDDVARLRRKLVDEITPRPGGRQVTSAFLDVVNANPGHWTSGTAFSIVLDGKAIGSAVSGGPSPHFRVSPGNHRVQCRNGLRRSNIVEFTVAPGARARLMVRMSPLGRLDCEVADT